jgi:DNA-binding NarL/FixJ family response regulator
MNGTEAAGGNATNGTATAARKLRVFLADDHAIVREGLKTLVNAQSDMEVTGEAESGEGAWRAIQVLDAQRALPDVVVMDVSMPNWNGAEATVQVRRAWPDVKVLALSMHEDRAYLRSLLEAGASGYVLKRSAADELVRALRAVAAGGTHLDPALSAAVAGAVMRGTAVTAAAGSSAAAAAAEGKAGPPQWPLTERESSVLRLLAGGHTTKEAAAQLGVSIKSVETYKVRGMKKLGLGDRVELVRYALAQGWLQGAR